MASRKVPVHRPSRPAGGGGRSAPHPGVSGAQKPSFVSPYQPPSGGVDLGADVTAMDPDAWRVVMAGGMAWRAKVPSANAIGLLSEIIDSRGGTQIRTINMFLAAHLHAEDMARMLERMVAPDDSFGNADYQDLYRAVVTLGTARPFWLS